MSALIRCREISADCYVTLTDRLAGLRTVLAIAEAAGVTSKEVLDAAEGDEIEDGAAARLEAWAKTPSKR